MGVAAAVGVSLAGSAVSAYGQIQAGRAQARVARHNQQLALAAAVDARLRGDFEEGELRRKASSFIGRQRTVIAESGAVVDEGTALNLTQDTAQIAELNALAIRVNAAREAFGFEAQAFGFGAEADLSSLSGTIGGIGALLLGGSQAASIRISTRAGRLDPLDGN